MKQVALGRKNWLFIGSVAAGERAADFLTLAGSTDYHSLRPDVWKQSHPEAVRTYRAKERRDRADHKQRHRAQRRGNH